MEQADGVGLRIVGAERVGADELGEAVRLVDGRAALRAHLVKNDRATGLGKLPGGLASRQTGSDDMYGFHGFPMQGGRPVGQPSDGAIRSQGRSEGQGHCELTAS